MIASLQTVAAVAHLDVLRPRPIGIGEVDTELAVKGLATRVPNVNVDGVRDAIVEEFARLDGEVGVGLDVARVNDVKKGIAVIVAFDEIPQVAVHAIQHGDSVCSRDVGRASFRFKVAVDIIVGLQGIGSAVPIVNYIHKAVFVVFVLSEYARTNVAAEVSAA